MLGYDLKRESGRDDDFEDQKSWNRCQWVQFHEASFT
jgi:hypothetical protein